MLRRDPHVSRMRYDSFMKHLLWFVPLVVGLAAMSWPKLQGLALLAMLVCGLVYLVMRVRRTEQPTPTQGAEHERDYYGVHRDIPPPSN
jgi:hypothetical protein